jgi:two-component system, OmpR family, copper resistance phosphate regulon response regulator CusR
MPTILVIEDDERVASLIKRGLEEQQYEVDLAVDGHTGRKLLLSKDYSVIIMDIMLPDGNGLEICKQAKSIRPGIPVIMLTALGTTDDKLGGFDAGADDNLVKPFDFRELHARIKVLTKRNPACLPARIFLI